MFGGTLNPTLPTYLDRGNVSVIKATADGSPSDSSNAAAAAAAAAADTVVELEMDELNQHECMSSLIAVIRHMQLNAVTPAVEQVITYYSAKNMHFTYFCCTHF